MNPKEPPYHNTNQKSLKTEIEAMSIFFLYVASSLKNETEIWGLNLELQE
jgi:hypothetical protein